ncbi:MAG: HD domain-containing protein [Candidatus Pacearchaeota archaeon]|jgi:dGTPase
MQALDSTKGRRYEENCLVKIDNPFLEDRTRIYQTPSYRRLGSKTQVMPSPEDFYIRRRLSHTQEVDSLGIRISESLGLNTSLCEAIATGHDIGHAPYGHLGESVISEIIGKPFHHNVASVVVLQHVENRGKGCNLSFETLEGILYHSRSNSREIKASLNVPHEYNVVMNADKIAYTSSDINDAIRSGYLFEDKLPDFILRLGKTQEERDMKIVKALIEESKRTGKVQLSEGEVARDFNLTRNFMFDNVYHKIDNTINRAILRKIYDFFSGESYFKDNRIDPLIGLVLLTDEECNRIGQMMMGSKKFNIEDLKQFSLFGYLSNFSNKKIDFLDPDLNWGKDRVGKEI